MCQALTEAGGWGWWGTNGQRVISTQGQRDLGSVEGLWEEVAFNLTV